MDIAKSAQYVLAAESTPQEARVQAIQRAEAGEKITLTVAKELIEAQQAQRRAEEAARVAPAEVEQAREQLAQQEEHTRAEIASLTHQLTALEKHRAELAQPSVEVREVEKMVIPPEVTAQLAQLQAQVQTVTEQRENLARKAAQLGADLAALRDATQAACERDAHHLRIGQHWREVTDTFSRQVGTLLGHFPSGPLLSSRMSKNLRKCRFQVSQIELLVHAFLHPSTSWKRSRPQY